MALSVPRRVYPGLVALARLDDVASSRLARALSEVAPAGNARNLAAKLSSNLGDPPISDLEQIIQALVDLHTGQAMFGLDTSDFIGRVWDGLLEASEPSGLTNDLLEGLRKRLEEFLGLGGAALITSKAAGILADHEHIFIDSRILTDVRAVFGESITESPAGAVIVHMLAVHFHESLSHKEIFFALDPGDLRQLKNVIDRAIEKEEVLRRVIHAAELEYLGD